MIIIDYDRRKEAFYLKGDTYQAKDEIKSILVGSSAWKWNGIVDSYWGTKSYQLAIHTSNILSAEISDEAQKAIDKKESEEKTRTLASFSDNSVLNIPCREGLSYKPYQKAGIEFMLKSKNVLLADQMRLGKTIQTIGFINAEKRIDKVLVVCPSTLKLNWAKELSKWLTRPFDIHIYIDGEISGTSFSVPVKGTNFTYGTMIPKNAGIIIINYEQTIREKIFNNLIERNYDLMVIDESHRLKSMETKRTISIYGNEKEKIVGIIDKSWKKICITGTPIPNRVVEIWPTISKLCPERFGHFFNFVTKYCDAKQETIKKYNKDKGKSISKNIWKFNGASNLDELQKELRGSIMLRRLRKDVLPELSEKERESIIIPVDAKDISSLIKMEANEYENKLKLTNSISLAFHEIAPIRHEIALKKVPFVIEYIQDFISDNEDQKVIVFAHHKDVVQQLYKGLEDYKPVLITGDTDIKQREKSEDYFRNSPDVKVIICSILAAGVGIDLSASSFVVFAEIDWVPGNMFQAEDRSVNIHKKDSISINYMVFDGSLDEKIVKTLIEKQAIADKALNV